MIERVDNGFPYEYWGSRGFKHEWSLEDDYGQEATTDKPYYVEVKVERNGKTKWLEVFVDEDDIIGSLRELCPDWFEKVVDEETGEEIELCNGYPIAEVEDDPSLVCEQYTDSSSEDDYWDRVDYAYEQARDRELEES